MRNRTVLAAAGAALAGWAVLAVTAAPAASADGSPADGDPGPGAVRETRDDAQPQGPPRLRREGRWLVDPRDRVVLLHGVNAVWKLSPYCPPASPSGFTARDAAWLADHGFNTVRLGTLFVGVLPEPGHVDHGYLDCIDRVVDLLAAEGIWVQLDAHQDMYHERYGGEGFPEWAVHDDGLPPPEGPTDLGFPNNYFHPATSRAFDNLYADTGDVQEDFAAAWRAVAERWRDQPYLMGYDLLNEPWPGTQWETCATPRGCPVFDSFALQPMFERLLAAIRAADRHNVVWLEPNVTFNSGAPNNFDTLRPLPDDANLGFSWHNYCLLRSTATCPIFEEMVFDNAEEAVDRIGAATLLSEFGATDDQAELRFVTRLADDHLVSWQYWHYKSWNDPTTVGGEDQSLFEDDADLSTVKLDKLRVLERTYPQATAGVPRHLEFDPDNGDFRYVYRPRPAAGPTVIYVPPLHYPDGYQATVTGARVTSPPGASRLTLRNLQSAETVVVEVTAR